MRSKFIKFCNLLSIVLILGTFLGGLVAYWAGGSLTILVLSAGLAGWHCLVLVTGALLSNTVGARRFARLCVIGIAVTVVQICVGMMLGYQNYRQNVQDVRLFSLGLVSQLEAYKTRNGRYPDDLNRVAADQTKIPHFTRETLLYYHNGERFLLSVMDPDQVGRFWLYDSSNKHWKLTRF